MGYGNDLGDPPIIDLKFSKDPADAALFNLGYYRFEKDLNTQCTFSLQRVTSFLYYRRNFHISLGYSQVMLRTLKIITRANQCSTTGDTSKIKTIIPDAQKNKIISMVRCDLCLDSQEDEEAEEAKEAEEAENKSEKSFDRSEMSNTKGLGRIVWQETLPPSQEGGYSRKRTTVYVGEVHSTKGTLCEARGMGELTVETTILKPKPLEVQEKKKPTVPTLKRSKSSPLLKENYKIPNTKSTIDLMLLYDDESIHNENTLTSKEDQEEVQDEDIGEEDIGEYVHTNEGVLSWLMGLPRGIMNRIVAPVVDLTNLMGDEDYFMPFTILLEKSNINEPVWQKDDINEDYSYRGIVRQYKDSQLYTYKSDSSSKSPWHLMCLEWNLRYTKLAAPKVDITRSPETSSETSSETSPEISSYGDRLSECIRSKDDESLGEHAIIDDMCRHYVIECVLGGSYSVTGSLWTPGDPGIVGGPPIGRVSDYFKTTICSDTTFYVTGKSSIPTPKIFYKAMQDGENVVLNFEKDVENFNQDQTMVALDDALRIHGCERDVQNFHPGKSSAVVNNKKTQDSYEHRPVPDGYGIKTVNVKLSISDNEISQRIDKRGQFRRGLQNNVGAVFTGGRISTKEDYVYHRKTFGITELDTITFGTIISSSRSCHKDYKRSVYNNEKAWSYEGFFARVNPNNVPKFNIWPGSDTSVQVLPAWLGRVRDHAGRNTYSGQFGIMYPHGIGTYFDWTKGSIFRGVIKKEYDTFNEQSFSKHADVITAPLYVPVLAGVLTRMYGSSSIPDDLVIGMSNSLNKDSLPDSLLDLEAMYFTGRPFPLETKDQRGTPSIECRSRAILEYDLFIKRYLTIVKVYKGFTKGISLTQKHLVYPQTLDVQGTGNIDDIIVMGRDANKLVEIHAKQAIGLRNFLRGLEEKDNRFIDEMMKSTLSLLSLGSSSGQKFDASDLYWRRMTTRITRRMTTRITSDSNCESPLCMSTLQAATHLSPLGPLIYVAFNRVNDFVSALDELLSDASEMVCLRCFLPPATKLKTTNLETFENLSAPSLISKLAKGRSGAFPKVSVGVTRIRGVPSNSGKLRVKISLMDRAGTVLETLSTDKISTALFDVTLTFGEKNAVRADNELLIEVESITGKLWSKSDVLGVWKEKITGLVSKHRKGNLWYRLTKSEKVNDEQMPLSIELNFDIDNVAVLLKKFPQNFFPIGCGSPSAISALIRNLEDEIPSLNRQLGLNDDVLECISTAANENDFSQNCEAPPNENVKQQDSSLRKLIYGGLFNFEGNSVSVFEDLVEDHSFFQGPRYFSEMIKSSK